MACVLCANVSFVWRQLSILKAQFSLPLHMGINDAFQPWNWKHHLASGIKPKIFSIIVCWRPCLDVTFFFSFSFSPSSSSSFSVFLFPFLHLHFFVFFFLMFLFFLHLRPFLFFSSFLSSSLPRGQRSCQIYFRITLVSETAIPGWKKAEERKTGGRSKWAEEEKEKWQ